MAIPRKARKAQLNLRYVTCKRLARSWDCGYKDIQKGKINRNKRGKRETLVFTIMG